MDKLHLNQLQPVRCPCIQASFSTKNHENRAKNGKFFTVEFAQKASQPLKFSPYFNHRAAAQKKKNFGLFYHNMTSCSQASFPAIQLENGQQNGKFFTVASAPFVCQVSYFTQLLDYSGRKCNKLPEFSRRTDTKKPGV
jgi:hypothetical protein